MIKSEIVEVIARRLALDTEDYIKKTCSQAF